MTDKIAKILIFPILRPHFWGWWIDEVWRVDLDSQLCCNGYMCGCYGSTHREKLTHCHWIFRLIAGQQDHD